MLIVKTFGINASYILVALLGVAGMWFAATTQLLDFKREPDRQHQHSTRPLLAIANLPEFRRFLS